MFEKMWIVFTKEVTDNLRDRRTLLGSLVYPLLGPVLLTTLLIVLGNTISGATENPLRLPVGGAEYAPELMSFLRQSNVEIVVAPADPERAVREGEEEVVLIVPEEYEQLLRAGRPAPVRLVLDDSRQSSIGSVQRARLLLERYSLRLGSLRLLARGVSPSVASALAVEEQDVATPQSQAANLLSMAPYFIIFSIFLGGMYLAIDTTTGERERGSLEPLLINPVSRGALVLGKLGATLLFTCISVVETLLGFGLLLNLAPLEIAVSLDPWVLVTIFFITLPMMLLAAALQLIIASFTHSFKEAQNYLSVAMLVPALPGMFLAFVPVRPALWMMLIPTFGQQLLINLVMRGSAVNPVHAAVSAGVTMVVGVILAGVAVKLYDREQVLFQG